MKSYIKSSFLAVLFLAVFSVGFSSANAKTPVKNKITKNTNTTIPSQNQGNVIPLRCMMHSTTIMITLFTTGNAISYGLLTQLSQNGCTPQRVVTSSGNVIVVTADCHLIVNGKTVIG